ncbi:flagellar hook-length control protein FliK [Thiomicrorhabdus sp. Kp2]|uniref:flagellar hook-length control protein FliK n=1 Tax=Thiomicrorhabdus sp. Kp2 TaxID=1123518 RepID=UPI0004038CD2|nr:flagellar hook-length control protein FliK [Thiomicrorhabdus sp. Kp2]
MVTISNSYLNTQALTVKTNSSVESLLKLGQILNANIQSVSGNKVQLTIGNQTLIATSKTPIQETGTIQVKVNQVKPDLQLVIVTPQNKQTTSTPTTQTLQAAYRQFIPLQAPLTQVFQQITVLQSLPPSLQAPVQQLLDLVSKSNQSISGDTLKQKLANSGLFLESKLSSGKTLDISSVRNDVKAQILQLQQQVSAIQQQTSSSALTKLATLLDQALSRITVQQIQMFENPNITPLEIPFERDKKADNDQIEIRQNKQEDKDNWEAYIDLTLPQGLLSVKLRLSEENELDSYIWTETEELKNIVENDINILKELLVSNEINLKTMLISPNKPKKTDSSTKIALIDIKI